MAIRVKPHDTIDLLINYQWLSMHIHACPLGTRHTFAITLVPVYFIKSYCFWSLVLWALLMFTYYVFYVDDAEDPLKIRFCWKFRDLASWIVPCPITSGPGRVSSSESHLQESGCVDFLRPFVLPSAFHQFATPKASGHTRILRANTTCAIGMLL